MRGWFRRKPKAPGDFFARVFQRRCHARIDKHFGDYGRCEFVPHSDVIPHTIERGTYWLQWHDAPVKAVMPNWKR